MPFLSYIH